MSKENCCASSLISLRTERDCKKALKKVNHVSVISHSNKGVKNSIDLTTIPIPESVFKDLYMEVIGGKRLHTMYDIKNTEVTPPAEITKDWNDGTSSNVGDEPMALQFIVPETDLNFVVGTERLSCKGGDVFLHLVDGKIVGYANRDTIAVDQKLYPIPVQRWTLEPHVLGTDSEVAHVMITITFDLQMSFENWIVVESSEHEWDETQNYEAEDAKMVLGSTATSTASIEVVVTLSGFGILGNSIPLNGLDQADFVVNVNGAPDPLATVAETPNGTYLLTFDTPASSTDVVTVDLAPTTGFVSDTVTDVVP